MNSKVKKNEGKYIGKKLNFRIGFHRVESVKQNYPIKKHKEDYDFKGGEGGMGV